MSRGLESRVMAHKNGPFPNLVKTSSDILDASKQLANWKSQPTTWLETVCLGLGPPLEC